MQNLRRRVAGIACAAGIAIGASFAAQPAALADTGSSGSSGSMEIYLPISTPAGVQALNAAVTQIGKPYKWGGTGPNSWDCSGLVQWAFRTAGIQLPRVSQQQARVGHAIPFGALAPGDIMIFWRDASHVGIYAGFGQVFNAYGPNGVPIGFTPLDRMPPLKTIRRLG
ncbi:C40 family peptidase [Gordonia sp. DT218]|uniref:C40 family peptidase n=1 Tax=unclassified Gordonia (in: high G+C Gram-positive bacteria) TaxID=2657482 RepID=UPI003CF262F4